MLNHAAKILKWTCLVLAAILVYRVAHIVPRLNPLAGVVIPTLPTLASEKTNSPAKEGTNFVKATARGTNKLAEVAGTNSPSVAKATNELATNSTAEITNGVTNLIVAKATATTNDHPLVPSVTSLTNARSRSNPNLPPHMMQMAMGSMGRGAAPAELPPEIKARVERIYESEILGQAMRPLPMGLLGIAGDVAFLRSASGQTGLVKEGDNLGDLKLLRVGINRVLVEQNGQKKELMIFDGYGSKSLLPENSGLQK